MIASGRIVRMILCLALLIAVIGLLFPNGFAVSQEPEPDGHQVYLPLVRVAPQDVYRQFLNSLGGSDNLFTIAGQLGVLGRGHQVVILDLSVPENPRYLTEILLPAVPNYLVDQDGYGYLTLGEGGFAILDLSQPAQAHLLSRLPLAGKSTHLLLSGNLAYVSNSQAVYVLDISQPSQPRLQNSIPRSAYKSQFYDSLLLIMHDMGFTLYDVSEPANIVEVGKYEDYYMLSILAVGDQHVYGNGWGCGMHGCDYYIDVIDISNPSQPIRTDSFDTINQAGSMWIDGDTAYIADNSLVVARIHPDGGLEKLAEYPSETGGGIFWSGDEKVYLSRYSGIEILDVSDPEEIEQIGEYTSVNYAFGWPQTELPFIYTGARRIDAEGDPSTLLVLDISDIDEPELVNETPYSSLNIQPKLTSDQVYLDGNRMYLTTPTGEYAGFFPIEAIKIFDLQTPIQPIELAEYLPGAPNDSGVWFEDLRDTMVVQDAIGYIMTMGKNLEIVDFSDPAAPQVLNTYPANARIVKIDGSHAYLTSEVYDDPTTSLHLLTLDIADLSQPVQQSDYVISPTFTGYYYAFDVREEIAYLALPHVLRLIDVSDPTSPTDLGALPIISQASPSEIEVEGDVALFGVENRLEIIDVSDPISPTRLSTFDVGGSVTTIQILDQTAYIASLGGEYILDISQPDQPRLLLHYPGYAPSMAIQPGYPIYIARLSDGLEIYQPYPPVLPGE